MLAANTQGGGGTGRVNTPGGVGPQRLSLGGWSVPAGGGAAVSPGRGGAAGPHTGLGGGVGGGESQAEPWFDILSNPEFLAEGTAVRDLLSPDRVLIGSRPTVRGRAAAKVLAAVYAHWVPESRILLQGLWSAELAKLAANAMLAQRVTSINAVAAVCEATGGDIEEIARAVGTDSRLGDKFLQAGLGYGGSCFRKDILSLTYLCETFGLPEVAAYWHQVVSLNDWTKARFTRRVIAGLFGTARGKSLAVLGFAFKAGTGDTRDSPAINVCRMLLEEGALVRVHDPAVQVADIVADLERECPFAWDHPAGFDPSEGSEARPDPHAPGAKPGRRSKVADSVSSYRGALTVYADPYEACLGCEAILVLTEWPQFRALDWARLRASMSSPAHVFDGRLCLDHAALEGLGFLVHVVGKPDGHREEW